MANNKVKLALAVAIVLLGGAAADYVFYKTAPATSVEQSLPPSIR